MDCLEESATPTVNSESNRLSRIRKARAKLVNEEHRLALMKKIRQSQTRPVQQQPNNNQQSTTSATSSSSATVAALNQNDPNASQANNPQLSNVANNLNYPQTSQQHQLKKLKTSQQSAGSSSSSPNTATSTTALSSNNNFTNNMIPGASAAATAATAAAAAAQMVSRLSALQKNSSNPVGLNLSALAGLNTSLPSAISTPAGSQSQIPTPAHAHQRPKLNNLWNGPQQSRHPTPVGIAPPHVGNMSRNPITTPPNVVQAMISNLVGQQTLLNNPMNNINSSMNANNTGSSSRRNIGQQQSSQLPNSFPNTNNKTQSAQSLMQKQQRTSSKASLQKQIEQTLLLQNPKLGQMPGLNNFPGAASLQPATGKRSSSSGIVSPHVGNPTRQPITTPPNVVQDMRGNLTGQQQSILINSNNPTASSGSRRSQQQQPQQQQLQTPIGSPFSKPQAAQMLLQKRSAAKLAIQKQLEQTLLQLPQQKQIQLGIDFLPNANMEFCYALGLEACVDYLTKTKSPVEAPAAEKPNVCSTCGSDFTPSWSWKRSQVMCENCVGTHMRKSIKTSHASRIKSVLAKVTKQEQEIDQKIMAEAVNVVSSASSPSSSASPLTTSSIINNNNGSTNINNNNNTININSSSNNNQVSQHSLLQQPTPGRNSNNQSWNTTARVNHPSPLANSRQSTTNNTPTLPNSPNVQPNLAAAAAGLNPANLLSNLSPAVIASLLQMNQVAPVGPNNQNNQLAQMAQLLMNQLTMNLMRR